MIKEIEPHRGTSLDDLMKSVHSPFHNLHGIYLSF